MTPRKGRTFLLIVVVLLVGTFLATLGAGLAEADPLVTPTLIASAWNYLPVVRGAQLGPTPLPPIPLPTFTPGPTATSSPTSTAAAQVTATQTTPPQVRPQLPLPIRQCRPIRRRIRRHRNHLPLPRSRPRQHPGQPTHRQPHQRPPAGTGDIQITEILFDGAVPRSEADEYVEIKNFDNKIVQLKGWKLQDKDQNHTYTFPLYSMKPGEICRVYTNQNHPETCGFNWGHGSAIWNNDGDTATLKDGSGKVIDTCSYTGSGTKVRC